MIYIGNHVSIAKGYLAMGREEESLGGDTFSYFTRNPRGGNGKEVLEEDLAALGSFLQKKGFGPLVAHAPYTMNLCSAKEEVRSFSRRVFEEDLQKVERLSSYTKDPCYFNFHPGSHLGAGYEKARDILADILKETLAEDGKAIVLLETMAGKGTEVGRSFEELAGILERVGDPKRLGVCFDTCHVWDGGYDIVSDLDGVLRELDHFIGLERLYAVHLNDSKNPLGSHKDRHEKLGLGYLGKEALARVICHPLLQGKPFILETPNEEEGYREEIAFVREVMTENKGQQKGPI